MTEIMIKVVGAHAVTVRKDGRLTTGMVGAVARFSFDGVWKDLVKVAVFRGSGVTRDVLEWDGDAVRIPAEVLAAEGRLFVGVEGRNTDGSVVIPTVWVECGVVVCGANASGDVSTDPDLPVWAQIQSQIGPLEELQTKVKENIVGAINEALRSGGGSVDEDAVERIVEEYLREHPVETDKELLVEGAPADAYVTGQNIRNIGTAVNALERVSRYMTNSAWALKIDSVAKTVTVPAGMLACTNWCIPVAEQTVAIVQDDPTTLVVYDSSADAVRSVRCTDFAGKTMYVIAVITAGRYAEPNANWVQGSYVVDGILVGGGTQGGGLSTSEKDLLLLLFKKAVYTEDVSAAIRTLEGLFRNEETEQYAVVNVLTDVVSDNAAARIQAGAVYAATLTPSDGMKLGTVTVTMGGIDVTGSVYSDGIISIPSVTGDVIITASAVEIPEYEKLEYVLLKQHGFDVDVNGTPCLYPRGPNDRHSVVCTTGSVTLLKRSSSTPDVEADIDSGYFPIPIPYGAKTVTIGGSAGKFELVYLKLSGSYYEMPGYTGIVTGSCDVTQYNDGSHYFVVTFRTDQATADNYSISYEF